MEDESTPAQVITEAMIRRVIREEVVNHSAFMGPSKRAYTVKRGFRTAEAADYIGVSVSQLHMLKNANKIPARKQEGGKLLVFLKESLDAYLEGLDEA